MKQIPNLYRDTWGPLNPNSTANDVESPLKIAVYELNNPKVLTYLVNHGLNVNSLWAGVYRGFGGQRVEIRGISCLTAAIAKNDLTMIKKLVQLGKFKYTVEELKD